MKGIRYSRTCMSSQVKASSGCCCMFLQLKWCLCSMNNMILWFYDIININIYHFMYIWSIFLLSIFLSYVFNAIGYMYMNRKMKTCQVKLNSSFNINCEVILKKKCGILNASPTPHCSLDENYTVYTLLYTEFTLTFLRMQYIQQAGCTNKWHRWKITESLPHRLRCMIERMPYTQSTSVSPRQSPHHAPSVTSWRFVLKVKFNPTSMQSN